MRIKVELIRAGGKACEARSENDLLFVFGMPAGARIKVGHELEIDPTVLNATQTIRNLTTGQSLTILVRDDDVHDLRLPGAHGGSRFPSKERLGGA